MATLPVPDSDSDQPLPSLPDIYTPDLQVPPDGPQIVPENPSDQPYVPIPTDGGPEIEIDDYGAQKDVEPPSGSRVTERLPRKAKRAWVAQSKCGDLAPVRLATSGGVWFVKTSRTE